MLNEPYILFLLLILLKSFNFQEVLIFGSCVTCLYFYEGFDHEKILIYPGGEVEFYNIGQNPSSNIFMKVPLCTSVASVFTELQTFFLAKKDN